MLPQLHSDRWMMSETMPPVNNGSLIRYVYQRNFIPILLLLIVEVL